jgi:cyanophycin synthetase
MNIKSIRAFAGASVYSSRSALMMQFDAEELKGKKSSEIAGFKSRLLEILPGLSEHFCDAGEPGGFIKKLDAGTPFNHVIEHAALELMALAGIGARSEKVCGEGADESRAIIETTALETTRFLMPAGAELVESIAKEQEFFFEEKIAEARRIAADFELDPSAWAIVEAAEKRGIPWRRENDSGLLQLGYGKNLHLVQTAVTDRTSAIGADLAEDKELMKRRLRDFSIPVPDGEIVSTEREAVEALRYIGAPFVVKPLGGREGKGVSTALRTPVEVVEAFFIAREFSSKVVVEEWFEGKNYRVLVVDGKMVAASERVSADLDGESRAPGAGMNFSNDWTARDVTDEVHPIVKALCERAARIIGLDVCGVDLVLPDISSELPDKRSGVVKINTAPDLKLHTHPAEGKPRDAGGAIVEMLYPEGKDSRIPIVSITGTNGKTTAARLISHILKDETRTVGTTTSTGIFLNGEQIAKGDTTGPVSARTILGDKAVGVAVLETARGGIVRRGLAYDWSDVSVVTNIGEDHIGQDGIESIEDIIKIKGLVAERVRAGGTLILNADDENSLRLLEREGVKEIEKKIVFFSLKENNPQVLEHLALGGTAFVAKNDLLVEMSGKESYMIADAREIPVTLGGTADFQTANALASIAACRALGISRELIGERLLTFRPQANNPGRNNLYKVGKGYVLVDYGHNTDGFAAICRMAARWEGKTVTGIIGLPGDRDTRLIEEAGQIAALGFHRVIVTEEVNLRGRAPGEIADLLCGAIKRVAPEKECEIIRDEIEAFSKAIKEMKENEVIVVFYRQLQRILEILGQNQALPISSFAEA